MTRPPYRPPRELPFANLLPEDRQRIRELYRERTPDELALMRFQIKSDGTLDLRVRGYVRMER